MKNNEETELRNAAEWLEKQAVVQAKHVDDATATVVAGPWARMLERAADRIVELETYIESRLIA